jgi:MbtH protein
MRDESRSEAMTNEASESKATHIVLINDEEQYSLWPIFKKIPGGWKSVGKEGTEEECMKYVDEVWTDMRPRSLRLRMEGSRQSTAGSAEN